MGNCSVKQDLKKEDIVGIGLYISIVVAVSRTMFKFHYIVGKGAFSKVWRTEKKKDLKPFAVKEMSKARILTKRSVSSVLNERKILSQLRNEYVLCYHPVDLL